MKKRNQQKLQLFSKENFRNISLSEKELNELRGGKKLSDFGDQSVPVW
jgi:hypothetical protein